MANNTLISNPVPQFLFADHSGDFGAAPATGANSLIIGSPTDVQMDCTGLAASGGCRISAKMDFGATRPPLYRVDACVEHETAAVDGETVSFWWAASPSATAATGNPGLATGSDVTVTDTTGNLGQYTYVGALWLKNTVVNIGFVGLIQPSHRYGMLVMVNDSTIAMRSTATAMDEQHITLTPFDSGTA